MLQKEQVATRLREAGAMDADGKLDPNLIYSSPNLLRWRCDSLARNLSQLGVQVILTSQSARGLLYPLAQSLSHPGMGGDRQLLTLYSGDELCPAYCRLIINKRVLLADDVIHSQRQILSLATQAKTNGGQIVGACALANCANLTPRDLAEHLPTFVAAVTL